MKKIPTLFLRDYEHLITDFQPQEASLMPDGGHELAGRIKDGKKGRFLATTQVTPGCEWVINGEGIATRKWDGACCKVEDGVLYKRHDSKNGKTPPEGFMPAQEPDPVTGHWPGWLKVGDGPEDKYFREAFEDYKRLAMGIPFEGTFEALGPKINGNRDGFFHHVLMPHGKEELFDVPRDFEGLKKWLSWHKMEGIVFHHPDGRMCKIKRSDFGLKW